LLFAGSEHLDGLTIARERIAREAEEKSGFLDSGCLGLSEVPDELLQLKHLRRLSLGWGYFDEGKNWHATASNLGQNAIAVWIDRLADLAGLQYLALCDPGLSDLTPLKGLTNLQSLDCSYTFVGDLAPLKRLTNLRSLICSATQVRDFSPLQGLNNLQLLDCSRTQVSDIEPLAGLSALQSLDCSRTQISDLAALAGLSALQSLDCSETKVSDLSPLVKLTALLCLDCAWTLVIDLAPLTDLAELQSLDCGHTQVGTLLPLAGLTALQSLDCGYTEVSDLSPLDKHVGLQRLDCRQTHISDLSPLAELAALRELDCATTEVGDLSPLTKLTALQSLDCHNTLVSEIESVAGLSALRLFNCFSTNVHNLSPLVGLSALQELDCGGWTHVSNLSPLAGLTRLKKLRCSFTQVDDLSPLAALYSLEELDCIETQVHDLSPIVGLAALQELDCTDTQVSDLSPLVGLIALRRLYCSKTHVSDVSPLAKLTALQRLDFSETQVSDLSPLAGLTELKLLDCAKTQVIDLSPLAALTKLDSLLCSGCRLDDLPNWLLESKSLKELIAYETRVASVPAEVLSQSFNENCLASLRAHFHDLESGSIATTDVKLIVLGNGRVGKTQICRRLRGEDYDETIDSTHGIVVTSAALPARNGEAVVRLHIWDFGGQDIYHGTHALFARSSAVFALIWAPVMEDRRTHEHAGVVFRNYPLAYWVDYVRHLGGKDIPALIVQTRCDRPEDKAVCPVSEAALKDAFGNYYPLSYSAANNRGRAALDEALAESVSWLHQRQGIARIGAGRHRVKVRLEALRDADARSPVEQRQYRTITQEQFQQICAEEEGPSEPKYLLAYLHNAGIVFYREGLFDDRIILDQSWALEAVYAVFHREKCYRLLLQQRGRFTRSLLELIVWQDYSKEEQELFLSMMQSCGICFVHKPGDERLGIEAEYVAPDLLPEKARIQEELDKQWNAAEPTEEVTFDYAFLHQGLIRAIISRIGKDAGVSATYWQGGVCVYEKTTRSDAMIEQETSEGWAGRIRLQTQGGQAVVLLNKLSELIEEEQRRIGLTSRRSERRVILLGTLAAIEDADVAAFAGEALGKKPARLGFGEAPSTQPRYYVSYAWSDEGKDREIIVDKLCDEAEKRGTPILRDKKVLGFGDSIAKFMKDIGKGDRVFVILSDKYLKSPFCMFELFEIWRNSRGEEEEFLKRCRVFTLDDAQIWNLRGRLKYAKYWKAQYDEVDGDIKEAGASILGTKDFVELKLMRDFTNHVGDILAMFANIVQPRSFEDLVKYGFTDPPGS
jgi:internalin A